MIAVVIIDHGSRYPAANEALNNVVSRMQELSPGVLVKGAHMELAEPSIAATINDCVEAGAKKIIAHPFMLSPGRHAIRDIPNLVYEAMSAHPDIDVVITPPLGLHDGIIQAIKDRCDL